MYFSLYSILNGRRANERKRNENDKIHFIRCCHLACECIRLFSFHNVKWSMEDFLFVHFWFYLFSFGFRPLYYYPLTSEIEVNIRFNTNCRLLFLYRHLKVKSDSNIFRWLYRFFFYSFSLPCVSLFHFLLPFTFPPSTMENW